MKYYLQIHHIPSNQVWEGDELNLTENSYREIAKNLHKLKETDLTLNTKECDTMIPQSIMIESVVTLFKIND